MKILVLNSGSSSQKACVYEIGAALPVHPPRCLWEGKIEFGDGSATVSAVDAQGLTQKEQVPFSSRQRVVEHLLNTLVNGKVGLLAAMSEINTVGHRVVHGGAHFEDPVVITREVLSAIISVTDLAPLHTPPAIEGIKVVRNILGDIPQVAVFDTGFHRQMPSEAAIYPGPYDWVESGIRRYGFHGINHQYCAARASQLLKRDLEGLKLVSCHIGNGCSVTAIDGGRSVDTTMGFTPLDGMMMGTRSGSVDPGILIYLMRQRQLGGEQIDQMLNHESGLLGISGVSSDMREILEASRTGHERAKLAFDIFVHRLRAAIGGMTALLGGIDSLIFTAGIGENSPEVRAAACRTLGFLGIELDRQRNAQPTLDADISSPRSRVHVLVIRAQEDWAIATECWKLVHTAAAIT